ncbi:MAG: U32 family peptidase [Deltaproteobacteria bacterium]|nr:U32 family peptidase [Deltaproteobacteria bacterium]
MKREIELLAPGGDIDSIKAAVLAGADAIYCGLNRFNARNRATNIDFEDLYKVLSFAHRNNCKVFLTLNIIIVGNEIPALIKLLNQLVNTSIDGVIVQDLGLFYILSNYYKKLKIHASTQLTTHNEGQINFLNVLNIERVNLCRELNIDEIKELTLVSHKNNISTEVFVHGSYCTGFSGLCYMSSVSSGNSGNRGRCSQPCRDRYFTTKEGKDYPLNLKDNSAFFDLRKLHNAGVDSLKIEGRIKGFDYVYTVVNCWKEHILLFLKHDKLSEDRSDLYKVFNRDFSSSFLKGDINKDMFIDNPRDNSIKSLSEANNYSSDEEMVREREQYYNEKEEIFNSVQERVKSFELTKDPILIYASGKDGYPLKFLIKTLDITFTVSSEINLAKTNSKSKGLDYDEFLKRFSGLKNTEYYIEHMKVDDLESNLFLPYKELTIITRKILTILNGSKEKVVPINIPVLKREKTTKTEPTLSVLISSEKDLNECKKSNVNLYFQLPSCLKGQYSELADLFLENNTLIPWFPSLLIEENYNDAVKFLLHVKPKQIVTNNTGIAYEAYKKGISWIGGPYLNIVNSFSLLCLKEKFNCAGAFISNEISKKQIKSIKVPENFYLYYSIYHPILLMTSRQCLHHQVTGCDKESIDDDCIQNCNKSSSITNLKKDSLYIKKTKGNYHSIYNSKNCINTDVVTDFPDTFTSFLIDLRDIKTETKINTDKPELIKIFEKLVNGNPNAKKKIDKIIQNSTHTQYRKGI